ncbi:MAG: hypothetical protein ABFD94_11180 [Armatimonadia bacterium]
MLGASRARGSARTGELVVSSAAWSDADDAYEAFVILYLVNHTVFPNADAKKALELAGQGLRASGPGLLLQPHQDLEDALLYGFW